MEFYKLKGATGSGIEECYVTISQTGAPSHAGILLGLFGEVFFERTRAGWMMSIERPQTKKSLHLFDHDLLVLVPEAHSAQGTLEFRTETHGFSVRKWPDDIPSAIALPVPTEELNEYKDKLFAGILGANSSEELISHLDYLTEGVMSLLHQMEDLSYVHLKLFGDTAVVGHTKPFHERELRLMVEIKKRNDLHETWEMGVQHPWSENVRDEMPIPLAEHPYPHTLICSKSAWLKQGFPDLSINHHTARTVHVVEDDTLFRMVDISSELCEIAAPNSKYRMLLCSAMSDVILCLDAAEWDVLMREYKQPVYAAYGTPATYCLGDRRTPLTLMTQKSKFALWCDEFDAYHQTKGQSVRRKLPKRATIWPYSETIEECVISPWLFSEAELQKQVDSAVDSLAMVEGKPVEDHNKAIEAAVAAMKQVFPKEAFTHPDGLAQTSPLPVTEPSKLFELVELAELDTKEGITWVSANSNVSPEEQEKWTKTRTIRLCQQEPAKVETIAIGVDFGDPEGSVAVVSGENPDEPVLAIPDEQSE